MAGKHNQTKILTQPYLPGNCLSFLRYLLLIFSSLLLTTFHFQIHSPFNSASNPILYIKRKIKQAKVPVFLCALHPITVFHPLDLSYPFFPLSLPLQQSAKRSNILYPLQELRINLFHSCLAVITSRRKTS